MEGKGNRVRHSLTLLLLMVTSIPVLTIQQKCQPGDYETEEGICCNQCAPGFKMLEGCRSNFHRSNCTPCSDGEYLEHMNFSPNCMKCSKCKAGLRNEYEESACRKDKNTICKCKKGYYKYNITSLIYECRKCKQCGTDEIQIKQCAHEHNIVCECKQDYYRVKSKCEPCTRCTPECARLCLTPVQTKGPDHNHPQFINIVVASVVVVVVLLALGIFITYMATKSSLKKKMLSQSSFPSVQPNEPSKDLWVNINEPSEIIGLKAEVEIPLSEKELSKLPDCVPMIPDLIYAVLDLVPVHQVKQLVRSLGVTDTEIEQAEMDHRFCREAHYQMLRVWAQRGGGECETVHQPLLDELLEKLRRIHLSRAAEELETKYAIQ